MALIGPLLANPQPLSGLEVLTTIFMALAPFAGGLLALLGLVWLISSRRTLEPEESTRSRAPLILLLFGIGLGLAPLAIIAITDMM